MTSSPGRGTLDLNFVALGGGPHHVGIVVRPRVPALATVAANTAVANDSDGGEVMRRRRTAGQVSVFGRV